MKLATVVSFVASMLSVHYGYGRHRTATLAHDFPSEFWSAFVNQLMIPLISGLTKMSVCLFVLRLIVNKYLRVLIYSVISSLALITTALFVIELVSCRPVTAALSMRVEHHCWGPQVFLDIAYFQGGTSGSTRVILMSG